MCLWLDCEGCGRGGFGGGGEGGEWMGKEGGREKRGWMEGSSGRKGNRKLGEGRGAECWGG